MPHSGTGIGSEKVFCPSCGAPAVGEFTDCQEMFDHLLARSFSDLTYGRFHRILVDLYSLQHPDKYCRSAKSFKFEEWCGEVWDAYSEHHELARRWISEAFGD